MHGGVVEWEKGMSSGVVEWGKRMSNGMANVGKGMSGGVVEWVTLGAHKRFRRVIRMND